MVVTTARKRLPPGRVSWHICRRVVGPLAIVLAVVLTARGDPEAEPDDAAAATETDPEGAEAAADSAERLALEQQRIADRYRRLEQVLLRMAELTAGTDPHRAALLRKAVAQSKERLIDLQFERLRKLLEQDQLARAVENHANIQEDLAALLDLLQSEDRAKQLVERKKRLGEYLKELNRIIKSQENIKHRTGGSGDPKRLAPDQGELADRAGGLADDIHQNEEGGAAEPGEGQPGERQPGERQPGEGQPGEGQPGEGEPGEGQPGEGQPGEGQAGSQAPHPARERLERARQNMKDAQEKLEEAKREGAIEDQEKALEELRQAKAELEEILRQLREEEMKRMLAMLEARFRQMLDIQLEVYEGTKRLDAVPVGQRSYNHEIEATRLSNREHDILVLIERAWMLLQEDGTTLALPLAVDELRDDVQDVVYRLAEAKVGKITQGLEEDIIAALEEIIEALKKAMKDLEDQQSPSPPMDGQPAEMPLVDLLAELKMIRALQMRVNLRTERYSNLIEGEQAEAPEIVERLRQLAERQLRVYRVTRDLHLGRNQ